MNERPWNVHNRWRWLELTRDQFGEWPDCPYCDAPFIWYSGEVDHIEAVAAGGTNAPWNLIVCCRPCNRSKHDAPLEVWQRRTGRYPRGYLMTRQRCDALLLRIERTDEADQALELLQEIEPDRRESLIAERIKLEALYRQKHRRGVLRDSLVVPIRMTAVCDLWGGLLPADWDIRPDGRKSRTTKHRDVLHPVKKKRRPNKKANTTNTGKPTRLGPAKSRDWDKWRDAEDEWFAALDKEAAG